MRHGSAVAVCVAMVIGAAGCGSQPATDTGATGGASPDAAGLRAVAEVSPTADQTARGTVMFTATAEGVQVTARISGLTPGEHGFHIHAVGDCSAPDASSAGDHFDPDSAAHGSPDADPHHAGDLGNLTAGESGEAVYEKTLHGVSLEGPNSIVGRAVVVHAGPDDMRTQPSGNSGGRIGCGVIQAMP